MMLLNEKRLLMPLLLPLLFFAVLFCPIEQLTAQSNTPNNEDSTASNLKISGMVGLNQDLFGYSTNDLLYRPYRPTSVTRLNVSLAFSYRNFSLPFDLSLSTQKGGNAFNSPIPQKFSFRDLLNSYNQLSFSPKFGSLQLLLGTQVPKYSELTTGDLPIFGAGAEWSPRKLRLAAFWGMSQRGVSWDTLSQQLGAFRRMSMTAKLGLGHQDSTHFHLIAARHRDNTTSAIVSPESGIRPQENVVGSVDFKLLLFKKFFIQGEGAVSAFSRDLFAAPFESDSFRLNAPRFLVKKVFVPRLSSSFGGGGQCRRWFQWTGLGFSGSGAGV